MKIAIDAGHGINTPGKRCMASIDPNQTREWVLNSRIANKIQALLAEYENVQTIRVDDISGQIDVEMNTRCKKANNWDADWYISCHHNAGAGGSSSGGCVVFSYINPTAQIKAVRQAIYDGVVSLTGLKGNRSQPLNTAEFYVLRYTDAPAILIEYGFMDSLIDTPIILTEEFADKAALGTVNGLVKSLNLKRVVANNTTTETEENMTRDEITELIDERINYAINDTSVEPSDWAKPYWKKAIEAGITDGSTPLKVPDRQEVVTMILGATRNTGQASDWAKDIWAKAIELGITDGTNPQRMPTRQEVVAMILKAMEQG